MASSRVTSDSLTHLPHPLLLLCISDVVGAGQRLRDLDDRHGEEVAGVHVTHIVWGREARMCIDEAVVDKCGICKHADLCECAHLHMKLSNTTMSVSMVCTAAACCCALPNVIISISLTPGCM